MEICTKIRLKVFFSAVCACIWGTVLLAEAQQAMPNVEKDESGYYYTIQKGDTLWDLSRRFLNSPYLWPDLWEANSNVPIPNPHLIFPGQKIKLFRKYDEEVVTEEDMSAKIPVQTLPEPISKLPAAVPSKITKFDSSDKSAIEYAQIDGIGFVRNPPIAPHGILFEAVGDKSILSTDDVVYISQSGRTNIILGKQYTVYRTFKVVTDERTGAELGVQHYLTGIIEIIKREPKFFIGKITKAFKPIFKGDKIMPYERRSPKIVPSRGKEGLKGIIIGTEEEDYDLLGQYSIAFIDKGAEHGIVPGQEYDIFYQKTGVTNPVNKEELDLTPEIRGRLIILLSELKTATVLITYSTDVIFPGANFQCLK